MKKLFIPIIAIFFGILISSLYVVKEGSEAVVIRFDKVIKVSKPGLHFKFLGIDHIQLVDTKINSVVLLEQQNDSDSAEKINQNETVQWKVIDSKQFYESVIMKKISINKILQELISNKTNNSNEYGIHIIDSQIQNKILSSQSIQAIYDKMVDIQKEIISEDQKRTNTQIEKIRSDGALAVENIISDAENKAQIVRNDADYNAFKLYAEILNKNVEIRDIK